MLVSIFHHLKSFFGNNFEVHSSSPLSGGDINAVFKIETTTGIYCIKINDASKFPNMFQRELEGLNLLRDHSDFHIPEALCADEVGRSSFLLMEYIEEGNKSNDFWERFGVSLANMHNQSNDFYGLSSNNYIGSLTQLNSPYQNWNDFYAENRILSQIKIAYDASVIDHTIVEKAERLCSKLSHLIPKEKPALLHGDLWSGNYMINNSGNPVLIDPAVYYGHREMDLAMTMLFGGFGSEMYEAYNRTHPLEKNWKDRIALFQLYPILVHVNLFGGSYVHQASRIIDQYT